jgi:phosphoglycerate dehydrogenase-like enzyme
MKIASLDVWTLRIQEIVRTNLPEGFEISFAETYDPAEQAALAIDADFILAGWAEVTGEMMRRAPKLRMIQKWGIGVDRIDLATAEAEGIHVAIAAGSNASPVAEHTLMLMLAVYRRLSLVDSSMRDGKWLFPQMRERCFQLRDKTVGLVGFGNIGKAVARKLAGLETHILYYDPVRPDPTLEHELCVEYVPSAQLLKQSDIVSLHLPGGVENRGLFDEHAFKKMKPGAVLINTARGELVNEDALCDALESGSLMGAGLDVFEPEPPADNARLLQFDQVILTPHTAGSVIDNVENVARHVFGNMQKLLNVEPIAEADQVVTPARPKALA